MRRAGAYRLVLTTAPNAAAARKLARRLVESGLVACANLAPGIRSLYRWNGKLCDDREVLLLLKTTARHVPALERTLRRLHPYEVPEILTLLPGEGSSAYLDWVSRSTQQKRR